MSPIPEGRALLVSDDEWLNAMRRYDDETEWGRPREDVLKGGVVELSRVFQGAVKAEPERFAILLRQFDQTISSHYFEAALNGLAESKVSADLFFEACEWA